MNHIFRSKTLEAETKSAGTNFAYKVQTHYDLYVGKPGYLAMISLRSNKSRRWGTFHEARVAKRVLCYMSLFEYLLSFAEKHILCFFICTTFYICRTRRQQFIHLITHTIIPRKVARSPSPIPTFSYDKLVRATFKKLFNDQRFLISFRIPKATVSDCPEQWCPAIDIAFVHEFFVTIQDVHPIYHQRQRSGVHFAPYDLWQQGGQCPSYNLCWWVPCARSCDEVQGA